MATVLTAKWGGRCRACNAWVEAGTEVLWERGFGLAHLQGQCPEVDPNARVLAVEDAGVYVMPAGEVVKVQANKAKTNVYAKRWVEITGQRLAESGQRVKGEWEYVAGLIRQVEAVGRKMTLEEAKAFILRYGQCARCGLKLKAAQSVERGIGPVCIKYFSAGATGAGLLVGEAA